MGERAAGRTCVRRDSSEEGGAFALRARGGFCSDSTALFGPSRCCWVIFGRMGIRLGRRRRGWPERLEPYRGGGSSLVGADLRSQRFFGRRKSFRAAREGWVCSDSTALFGPSRCCWVIFGRMGIGLRRRRGWPERLEPYRGGGSSLVGADLRLQRFFGRRKSFRAAREGWVCSDSTALFGPSRCCCWVIFGRMGIGLWRRRGWPERLEPYRGGGSSLVGADLRLQRFFGRMSLGFL